MTTKQVSKILLIGLLLKYFTSKTIVSWAEYMINRGESGEKFIDLILFNDNLMANTVTILKEINRSYNSSTSMDVVKEYFLGFYRELFFYRGCMIDKIEGEIIKIYVLDEIDFNQNEKTFFVL